MVVGCFLLLLHGYDNKDCTDRLDLMMASLFASCRLRPVLSRLWLVILLSSFSLLSACASRSMVHRFNNNVEAPYLQGQQAKAYQRLVPQLSRAAPRDRLLLLLQAGTILHSMQRWDASTQLFTDALALSDTYTKSVSEDLRTFFLNDAVKRYYPENFERVLLLYYLAVNQLMQHNLPRAYQYFKRMNEELQLIRDYDAAFKENYAARYLYALVATALGEYETARVQYNNLIAAGKQQKAVPSGEQTASAQLQQLGEAGLLTLVFAAKQKQGIASPASPGTAAAPAVPLHFSVYGASNVLKRTQLEAADTAELAAMFAASAPASDSILSAAPTAATRVVLSADRLAQLYPRLGQVVFIHEQGVAPYKVSRGRLGGEPLFETELKVALGAILLSQNFAALSYGQLFFWLAAAENPIPAFNQRRLAQAQLMLTGESMPVPLAAPLSSLQTSYADSVMANFNDRYEHYVRRHTRSLVTKVATVLVASITTSTALAATDNAALGAIVGFFINTLGGSIVKETLQPDLRAWSLALAELSVTRGFFLPGTYTFKLVSAESSAVSPRVLSLSAEAVTVKAGETVFVYARSY